MNNRTLPDKKIALFAKVICLFFIILTGFLAWQATHFEIDASADTLLVDNNRHHIISQMSDQRYGAQEFILIAFKPKSGDIFSHENLAKLTKLGNEISAIDRVSQVRSIANVPIFANATNFSGDVNSLTWQAQQYPAELLQKTLKNHPLYEGLLVNKQQTALALQVVFQEDQTLVNLQAESLAIKQHLLERDLQASEKAQLATLKNKQDVISKSLDKTRIEEITRIRSIIKKYGTENEFYLGGNNLLAYELINIIESDLLLFGSIILIAVIVILTYLFRQFSWVFLPIFCCTVSVIITLGLLAVFALKVTVISANVIALQIILSLAMIIHIIIQYQEFVEAERFHTQTALVLATIKSKFKPCFFAGITTTVGFATLIFSSVQPVISFGWMMVIAMSVSVLVSLIFFPALLISFFSIQKHVAKHSLIEGFMSGMATLVNRIPTKISLFTIIVTLAFGVGCFKLTAENSFLNYFSTSTDVKRELTFIDQEFGGSTTFDVLYKIPKSQQKQPLILSAETVQTITAIQTMLSQQKAIGNITSVADFTRIAQVVNGKPLTEYELTVLYKSLDKDIQQDLFGGYFSPSNNELRISTRIQDSYQGLNRADLLKNIHQELANLGLAKSDYQLTGLFVLYQHILTKLVDSQILTLLMVYAAMTVILMVIFSSLKIAVISLIPNIITTAIIMGIMGWFAIPLDLMTITIATVAMGISMDDTIHYVHRYLEENSNISKKGSADSSTKLNIIKQTNLSVGYALMYTTLIIIIGFGMLVFSNFVPSMLFGLLTSIAMFVALITDMTILPVMLKKYLT
ncbi:efflux RND transporter permease subunit [Thalassotalea castellviae]|uniref:MMPL family transporter n=1 Tax=Thalassotalea castellviae TaxID=3075612 RepID=A0ABU3A260_9GAMM|nr:MMPL family transporter [Thalassotalea sp. W431]MDT0604268.1 MMPL family transporter [Thalassotalea sp. W431]